MFFLKEVVFIWHDTYEATENSLLLMVNYSYQYKVKPLVG